MDTIRIQHMPTMLLFGDEFNIFILENTTKISLKYILIYIFISGFKGIHVIPLSRNTYLLL